MTTIDYSDKVSSKSEGVTWGPLIDLTWNDPIVLLHDHIINALLTAGQCVIHFTKHSKGSHKKDRPSWNEYVVLDFDHALHWYRIYLDHGCPSFGFIGKFS